MPLSPEELSQLQAKMQLATTAQASGNDPIATANDNPNGQIPDYTGTPLGHAGGVDQQLAMADDPTTLGAVAQANGVDLKAPPGAGPYDPNWRPQNQTTAFSGGVASDALPQIASAPQAPATPVVNTSTSRTVQQGIPLSAQTKALMATGQADMTRGQELEEKGLVDSQAAQHAAAQRQAALQVGMADQQAKDAAETEAKLAPQREAIKAATDDYASQRIDPDHFWKSKSTPQKISLVLAQMAGGFAAGFRPGTPDIAQQIIRAAQDDDMHSQEANVENKRKALQEKKDAYGLDSAAFATADQKKQAERVVRLNAAAAQIQDEAAQSNDPLARAQMQQVHAQVLMRAGQEQAQLDQMTANKVTTSSHTSTTSGGPAAGTGTGGIPADHVVRGPDGKMYLAPSPAAAAKLRDAAITSERLQGTLAQLKSLRDSGWGQVPGTEEHAKMQTLLADAQKDYTYLNGEKLKTSGKGAELIDQAFGSPDSLGDWHGNARLDALSAGAAGSLADAFKSEGAVPLDPGRVAVQNGKVVYLDTGIPDATPAKRVAKR